MQHALLGLYASLRFLMIRGTATAAAMTMGISSSQEKPEVSPGTVWALSVMA